MKYAVERGSVAMMYIHVHKVWFTHSKDVKGGGYRTRREDGDRIRLL
jgi:hypothetical protein